MTELTQSGVAAHAMDDQDDGLVDADSIKSDLRLQAWVPRGPDGGQAEDVEVRVGRAQGRQRA
jgi:hypothetical protein